MINCSGLNSHLRYLYFYLYCEHHIADAGLGAEHLLVIWDVTCTAILNLQSQGYHTIEPLSK